ncbi:MAG: GNAT family N-acetyltransferase [Microcella sp.]|uniref:GNAT family N-acetyltransferase n=1 Tax=Microcella sp. TaxID=1913979 RepID=UPI0033145BAA
MTDRERTPLRDRVQAPTSLSLPAHSAGYRWRTLAPDDAPLLTGIAERMSARDHPTWSESLEEMEEELERSWFEPSTDGVLCLDTDGVAVAYGLVSMPPDPESIVRVTLAGGVDPAHRSRGLGRRLLAWQHDRARQMLASCDLALPAWVMSYAPDAAPEHGALLQRAGFEPARYFTTLECDTSAARPASALPEGVVVVDFTAELSESVRRAKNTAFADHWGSQPTGAEQWRSMIDLPTFRPDLSRIALVDDDVVGFVTTEVNEEDWARHGHSSGYIGLVGTVRPWRRRGLASALLSQVMAAYAREGLERAVLDVDAASPTGALGVYTALGFTATARDTVYRRAY